METYLGNKDLLSQDKVAYICSKEYTPQSVLLSYDWATEQKVEGRVVISTFRSPLEADVLHFLLKSKQPAIIVLTSRMYKHVPAKYKEALDEGRLLIISLCSEKIARGSQATAYHANRYILSQVTHVVFGCVTPGSNTEKLYKSIDKSKNITIKTLL